MEGGGVLKAKCLETMYENKREFPGGRGMKNKKPSVGEVWISSGTVQSSKIAQFLFLVVAYINVKTV